MIEIIHYLQVKEIYHQSKSDIDILLELLKLDFYKEKIYEDGEYIVVEMQENGNVPQKWQFHIIWIHVIG